MVVDLSTRLLTTTSNSQKITTVHDKLLTREPMKFLATKPIKTTKQ
jgi:hypothetical protein